jgi:hypothetical protein
MKTKIKFVEKSGECQTGGTLIVDHSFENKDELLQYLKDNWWSLQELDDIEVLDIDINVGEETDIQLKVLENED